jgi:hypothetical protein
MSSMSMSVRIRLSIMMFLQYMMFAAWWVQLAQYVDNIGITGTLKALILSSMPLVSRGAHVLHDCGSSLLPVRRC